MKLLLHACCGPCSLEPVRLLRSAGLEPVIFYANSNIHPAEEYARRLATLRTWAQREALDVVEGGYDPKRWEQTAGRIGDAIAAAAEGEGAGLDDVATDGPMAETALSPSDTSADRRSARCRACYRLRFQEAAAYAAANGYDMLGTTLTVSPYQYTDIIHEELDRAAGNAGVQALFEDYRPHYHEATRRSRETDMYRQNYCGCRFSDIEAAAERADRKRRRNDIRAAEKAAHAEEHAAEEMARQEKRAERNAYADKQARKHAILKALREKEHGKEN